MPDMLPGMGDFLKITEEANNQITAISTLHTKGAFRIQCIPNAKTTEIKFDWDEGFTEDDFEFPCGSSSIVMDALSIAYILDDYTLDYVFGKFTLEKRK